MISVALSQACLLKSREDSLVLNLHILRLNYNLRLFLEISFFLRYCLFFCKRSRLHYSCSRTSKSTLLPNQFIHRLFVIYHNWLFVILIRILEVIRNEILESWRCTSPLLRWSHAIGSCLIIRLLDRVDLLHLSLWNVHMVGSLLSYSAELVRSVHSSLSVHILIPHLLQLVVCLVGLRFLKSSSYASKGQRLRSREYMSLLNRWSLSIGHWLCLKD